MNQIVLMKSYEIIEIKYESFQRAVAYFFLFVFKQGISVVNALVVYFLGGCGRVLWV